MNILVKIKFGSHLYGTSTPESDLDIKGVYIPCERDIMLQDVKPVISESRTKSLGEKNTKDDVDFECYSLQKYLQLLQQGQTVALDMLFAPEWAMIEKPDPIWTEIQSLASKLLSKEAAAFLRYCRQQANKYGIKGSRVSTARKILTMLQEAEDKHGTSAKLEVIHNQLDTVVSNNESVKYSEKRQPNGDITYYFEVNGKKMMLKASIKNAKETAQRMVDEYGQRALAAEKNEGVDWKALSHAIRVGNEAIELFETGKITFPRPEAQHLLDIKQGNVDYTMVAEEIEQLLEQVENAANHSFLPETSDRSLIDDFVFKHYKAQCISC